MAIRTDIYSVDYTVNPRVIWIDIGTTNANAQDLYDTVCYIHSTSANMDDPYIINAEGKTKLDEQGNRVGITVLLFDAVYAFADRSGPEWVICNMEGGNVVAFTDQTQSTILYPRKPTAYISADRTSSVSSTLQEQDAIQYSSYGGVVSVDITSSNVGTDYPAGNMQFPVNNLEDAVDIAIEKGFAILSIRGDITVTDSVDIDGYIVEGQNPTLTNIVVEPSASVYECEFRNAKISGTLDGDSEITDCIIDGLDYVSGRIKRCGLTGEPIILGSNAQALMIDCWSEVPGDNTPTIDAGGSGQSLAVRGHKGGFKLTNRTGTDAISIDFESGQFVADATITAGTVYVRGTVGKITVNCDPALVDIYGVTNPRTISEATWDHDDAQRMKYIEASIHVDTELPVNGDGSQQSPFNNMNDAKDMVEATGIKKIFLSGEITIPTSVKNINIYGIGLPRIHLNGQDLKNSKFYHCSLEGTYTDSIIAQQCRLENDMTLRGHFDTCELLGNVIVAPNSTVLMVDCLSGIPGLNRPTLSMNSGQASQVSIRGQKGGLTVNDCDHADDVITAEIAQGSLTFSGSCTNGEMVARGNCKFVDETNGATVTDETIYTKTIPTAVWEYVI